MIVLIAGFIFLAFYLYAISEPKSMSGTFQAVAQAIQEFEGWYPGSVAYRNSNPGNLKYAAQPGSVGQDSRGFAIFSTFEDGWKALLSLLQGYAARHPNWTLADLMAVYAPVSDSNNPTGYANFIGSRAGISAQTKLGELA